MAGSDRYDIEAKGKGASVPDQLRLMLQALLAERFKLAAHEEDRARTGYALVVDKGVESASGICSMQKVARSDAANFADWLPRADDVPSGHRRAIHRVATRGFDAADWRAEHHCGTDGR